MRRYRTLINPVKSEGAIPAYRNVFQHLLRRGKIDEQPPEIFRIYGAVEGQKSKVGLIQAVNRSPVGVRQRIWTSALQVARQVTKRNIFR